MSLLVGETVDLRLDRRTVTRTDSLDLTGKESGTVKVIPDDLVCLCLLYTSDAADE